MLRTVSNLKKKGFYVKKKTAESVGFLVSNMKIIATLYVNQPWSMYEILFNCRRVRLSGHLFLTLIVEHNDQLTMPLSHCFLPPCFFLVMPNPLLPSAPHLQLSGIFIQILFPSINVLLKLLLLLLFFGCISAYFEQVFTLVRPYPPLPTLPAHQKGQYVEIWKGRFFLQIGDGLPREKNSDYVWTQIFFPVL